MSELVAIEPVRRSITVECPMEEAFRVFTTEITSWWPLPTHSIHGDDADRVVFEEHEGGEVYELAKNGERAHWARVLEWEPPGRFVLAWHVNPKQPATELEVRFAALEGRTRVELEHRGWESFGAEGAQSREHYDGGWVTVLGMFEDRLR